MRAKPQRHKPYGLLKQLPVPERPWNSISMDFIEPLPPSSGCDSILVIVDRLTKQSIFIPTTIHCTSEDLAMLFVIHVFSKHGVPEHVTSDRGSEFVSRFFRSLGKALDMTLHYTSGYHPEGDGQTERTNQTLEQYLRIFCNYQQDNWHTLLPLAEFTYNNTPSSTTGISPFFANKGYHPNLTIHPERDLASAQAKNLVVNLDELHQELKATIAEAQLRYQGPADLRRMSAPPFEVGQQAFVKAKFFRSTRPSAKLSDKFLGPFDIIARTGSHSVTLRLPDTIHGVHPIFHVSMLEPATPNEIPNRIQSPPPPLEVQGELEYEISEILDSKIDRRRACKLLYLVRWLGYENTDEEYSWLPSTELEHASELISDFHSAYSDKPFVQSYTCSVIASYYVQESKIYCDTINLHFHFPLTSSVSIEPAFCIDSISSNSSNSSISDNSDDSSALYSPSMPRWMSSVSFLINSIRSNLFMVFSSALFSVTSAFSDCTCCPLALTILILLEIC